MTVPWLLVLLACGGPAPTARPPGQEAAPPDALPRRAPSRLLGTWRLRIPKDEAPWLADLRTAADGAALPARDRTDAERAALEHVAQLAADDPTRARLDAHHATLDGIRLRIGTERVILAVDGEEHAAAWTSEDFDDRTARLRLRQGPGRLPDVQATLEDDDRLRWHTLPDGPTSHWERVP